MAKQELYREKSVERISSPEALDEYIRVTNPGIWLLLCCIIFLLLGVFVWGYFGKLESVLPVTGKVSDTKFTAYVEAGDALRIKRGMTLRAGGKTGEIESVNPYPVPAGEVYSKEKLSELGISAELPLYALEADIYADNGEYEGKVVIDAIQPIRLLFN